MVGQDGGQDSGYPGDVSIGKRHRERASGVPEIFRTFIGVVATLGYTYVKIQ